MEVVLRGSNFAVDFFFETRSLYVVLAGLRPAMLTRVASIHRALPASASQVPPGVPHLVAVGFHFCILFIYCANISSYLFIRTTYFGLRKK